MPSLRPVTPALLLGLLVWPLLLRAQDTLPGLYGRVDGDKYIGPGGLYSITLPVLPELGGEIHDTESVVTFDDNLSIHMSVACFPLDAVQKIELESGMKDFLADFYTKYVLQDFKSRFPGTTAETTLYTPSFLDGALFGYALLPGGSAFKGPTHFGSGKPPVAKRGNLLFVKSGYIFVVSLELAERITQWRDYDKTSDEENEILRERLIQVIARMHFLFPKAPKRPANANP